MARLEVDSCRRRITTTYIVQIDLTKDVMVNQYLFARKTRQSVGTRVIPTVLTLLATLTSCGLVGGGSDAGAGSPGHGREKTAIKVSIMTTTDVAPFHIAVKEGYFEAEGLTVTAEVVKTSEQSTDKLTTGEVDVAYSSYQPLILAQSTGVARRLGGVRLVADASSAAPGSCLVVAMPNSGVRGVGDMAGKRVAVTSSSSISALLVMSSVKTVGVDPTSIKWVPMPFPQTADRLKAGDVDAAFLTEPFLTDAEKRVGAVPLFDTATGPTANFPTAGWAATGDFVTHNPDTVAKFQRAMQKATDLARSDRSRVEKILVEKSLVDESTAKIAVLLTFQSSLDSTRLQRVPDLMQEFGLIPKRIDASTMIVTSAAAPN